MSDDVKEKMQTMRQQVEEAVMMFEQMVEGVKISSKLLKARYDALIETGFTPEQALAIVCARGCA